MAERIGVLLDGYALKKALQGYRVHECIELYREIALAEDIPIVLFAVNGVNWRRNRVHGYIAAAAGWEEAVVPIPPVIHKRVLYRTSPPLRVLSRLRRKGVVFVNPYLIQNKYAMYRLLSRDPHIASNLPATWAFTRQRLTGQLAAGRTVVLKPRIGSVGRGVIRIAPQGKNVVQVSDRRHRRLTYGRLRSYLYQHVQPGRYLLQQYLPLAQIDSRPFDLRVPVQRDAAGEWTVPGMVAKISGAHPFLTNLAQGGTAVPGETALQRAFPPELVTQVRESILQLALNTARAIAATYRYAADLGLDIGVDTTGKPWLIEVNTRDQRITFLQAGMYDVYRTLYKNPLMYCVGLCEASRRIR